MASTAAMRSNDLLIFMLVLYTIIKNYCGLNMGKNIKYKRM